ncbi:hypothetical protein QBC35DRAFT_514333 [Podospora australis]|uniref:VWFA domain-containing protein n=1 Tax=Podospora australis TaxID=1536484 RepID=A0AAN6WYX5_9PEZI|nr:hypothetical protein QBC35DRAFT_514333 [Podospora australis]
MSPRSSSSYMTFSIRNLPPGTTKDDVRALINTAKGDAAPRVGQLIKAPNLKTLTTTVTLRQSSVEKLKDLRNKLNKTTIFPENPTSSMVTSEIAVSDEFMGITTLVEHKDAQFDLYFIHGLGGHAFRSWNADDGPTSMWPKDLLPAEIEERPMDPENEHGLKLAGRFSTIGYSANAQSSHPATTTIEKAAEDLLNSIRVDRPEGSCRPIYFACHSLGGLVTCQALIRALNGTSESDVYRKTFIQKEECLVKGIMFFGTPFKGSSLADFSSTIIRLLGGNTSLIESLKINSGALHNIVGTFNQVRNKAAAGMQIVATYEKAPIKGKYLVTEPGSAMISPKDRVFGIEGDHRTMIKFRDSHDGSYPVVSETIIRMIQDTLPTSGFIQSLITEGKVTDSPSPDPLPFIPRTGTFASVRTAPPPPPYASPSSPRMPLDVFGSPDGQNDGVNSPPFSKFPLPVRASIEPVRPRIQPTAKSDDAWSNNHFRRNKPVNADELIKNTQNGLESATKLSILRQFDTVFLIDDTASMWETDCDHGRSRWDELLESLQYIVDIVCRYDRDGCDVHFLVDDEKDELEIRDSQRILNLLQEVTPDETGGGTYMNQPLWAIVDTHVDAFQYWKSHRGKGAKRPKMLNLIVITDGAADDKEAVEHTVVKAAKQLDDLGAPEGQIGIQFLQIGKDDAAGRWLKTLDESLKDRHEIRDMVDTRPWNRPDSINDSFKQKLEKILLGAVDRTVDNDDD